MRLFFKTLIFLTFTSSFLFSQNKDFSLLGRWGNGYSNGVVVNGDIAYTGNGAYVSLIDVSSPESPVEISHVLLPGTVKGLFFTDGKIYAADGFKGAFIIDVSDQNNPSIIGSFKAGTYCYNVFATDGLMFLANGDDGLKIVDISNPASPVEISSIDYTANDVFVVGNYMYLAHDYRGIMIYDISTPSNPALIGMFDEQTLGYAVWVSGDYAYLGDSHGLRIIDVSDKTNPIEKSSVQTRRSSQDIFFNNGIVYLANQMNGLNVIDVTNPENPTLLSNYDTEGYSEGVWKSGDYVFVADGYQGLKIITAAESGAPVLSGVFSTAGIQMDVIKKNDYIFTADYSNGLQILKMNGKTEIVRIAEFNPIGNLINGNYASCLDVDNNYAYLGTKFGLYIIDVSDPYNPVQSGFYETSLIGDIIISGNYAYLAHPNDGFDILDISDPANPEQTGDIPGSANALALQGDYAYVVDYNGLNVIDVSDVYHPEAKKYLEFENCSGYDVFVKGNYAYIIGNSLSIVNIEDYNNLEIVGQVFVNQSSFSIFVSGNDAYVADNGTYLAEPGGLRTFNVSDPANPFQISFTETGGESDGLFVDGTEIYIADGGSDGVYYLNNDSPTDVENETQPTGFYLSQNFPNPFSKGAEENGTTIEYYVPAGNGNFTSSTIYVTLKVYDVLGREVATLVNKEQAPGNYSVQFSAKDLSSGIYFYKLDASNLRSVKKMIILK
ncbi:MAG: T9SS type A sorting domain-containing protein [Chlorobi bacterium]|nr:T9SS type A sorting domain-containing protein [Chlorobiota bacterium]